MQRQARLFMASRERCLRAVECWATCVPVAMGRRSSGHGKSGSVKGSRTVRRGLCQAVGLQRLQEGAGWYTKQRLGSWKHAEAAYGITCLTQCRHRNTQSGKEFAMHVSVVPSGRPTATARLSVVTQLSVSRRLVGAARTLATQQRSSYQRDYSMSGLLNEDGRLDRRCEMSPQQVLAKHSAGVYTTALMTDTGAVVDWDLHRRRLERLATALMGQRCPCPL